MISAYRSFRNRAQVTISSYQPKKELFTLTVTFTLNPESTAWNPESETVLANFLT